MEIEKKKKHHKLLIWLGVGTAVVLLAVAAGLTVMLWPKGDKTQEVAQNDEGKENGGEEAKPEAPKPSRAEQILAEMSLEEKVGQMFVVDTASLQAGERGADTATGITDEQKQSLNKYGPGGVAFFGGNIESAEQVKQYTADLQAASKHGMILATDQEGGIVDRLSARAGVTRFPNMAEIGASGDTNQAYNVGATYGKEMKALGLNVDFAPVADVNTNPNNPVIGVRAFGSDANLVAGMVEAEVKGLKDNGVGATLKHFPGHGDTSTDTHTGTATVQNDLDRLRSVEFVPFKAGIDAGASMVLTAHIVLPKVDASGVPATMSKTIITDILRGELGFTGVVITDALGMAAIAGRYSMEDIVKNCVGAGVDMLLAPQKFFEMYDSFVQMVKNGDISEDRVNESVLRILNLKLNLGIVV